MRTDADKELIASRMEPTTHHKNVIDEHTLYVLERTFVQSSLKVKKNTGPITLDIPSSWWEEVFVFQQIWRMVQPLVGDCRIFSALIFATDQPHIIHNDDSRSWPKCWKGINIPIAYKMQDFCEYPIGTPELVFFDQYYLDGPAKFFAGNRGVLNRNYNDPVYDYRNVKEVRGNIYDPTPFQQKNYPGDFEELSHLNPNWLSGLSVETKTPWELGSVSVFNTVRLHCATDFRRHGVRSKLAISIFTEKD